MATITTEKAVYERLIDEFRQLEADLMAADNGSYINNPLYTEAFNRFAYWFYEHPELALIMYQSLRRDRDYWKRLGCKWLGDEESVPCSVSGGVK